MLTRRCPLLGGFCDQGVLIGECSQRVMCVRLAGLWASLGGDVVQVWSALQRAEAAP